ncbi:DUF4339 domain-containing protein [Akkermansiaceae bacterium]|nr:DUF4339 domain-containing protein [Akkermansiaceae bacterium]
MTLWNYTKMGLQQGPVPEDELRQKIRRGEIGPTTLVWREGMAGWLPISGVAELQESPLATPTADAPGGLAPVMAPERQPANPQPGHIPLPQPPAYQGNYIAPQIPNYMWQSIVALVLSGVLMLLICLPIGMPFAIVALVYANKVEGLRVQGRLIEAESASKSAKVWMIVSFALSGLILLGLIGMFVFFAVGSF